MVLQEARRQQAYRRALKHHYVQDATKTSVNI